MAPGVFPENLRQIERETDFLKSNKVWERKSWMHRSSHVVRVAHAPLARRLFFCLTRFWLRMPRIQKTDEEKRTCWPAVLPLGYWQKVDSKSRHFAKKWPAAGIKNWGEQQRAPAFCVESRICNSRYHRVVAFLASFWASPDRHQTGKAQEMALTGPEVVQHALRLVSSPNIRTLRLFLLAQQKEELCCSETVVEAFAWLL